MNLWNLKYVDENENIEIVLIVKCKDLESAKGLAQSIAKREDLKLVGIYQSWTDMEFKERRF